MAPPTPAIDFQIGGAESLFYFDDLNTGPLLYLAREWSVCAPGPHGYPARIRSHSRKGPERPVGSPDHGCAGETVSPSPQSSSQTSVSPVEQLEVAQNS